MICIQDIRAADPDPLAGRGDSHLINMTGAGGFSIGLANRAYANDLYHQLTMGI
jgi:hypothetical protein